MTKLSDERAVELLRNAMPASRGDAPRTDLWPRVRRRIDDHRSNPAHAADWIVAEALALLCLAEPSLVGILLLHF